MEAQPTLEQADQALAPPYVGMRGRDLISKILHDGPECVSKLGSSQVKYCGAISTRKQIEWPKEFFDYTVDELMDRS
jgi:hypothetical protein